MTKTTTHTLARQYEIHACKAGITNDDLDGDYLNSGSVNSFDFMLHVFRDADDVILALLVEKLEGKDHWIIGKDIESRLSELTPSTSLVRSSRDFNNLSNISLYPHLLKYLFNDDWIVERVGEDYCGELNITDIEAELLENMKTGPALAVFSTYANCEIQLKADAPPDLSKIYPDYIDEEEAVRLYLGPPW
ncbi:MAG: hypothetical protein ACSHXK_13990 [Oceanococcus sp.]